MTVTTINQASNSTLNQTSNSDMKKRGAVRKNLFDSVPDRDELNGQLKQYENESNKTLSNFKIESVIGVIENASYQPRKLKRVPRYLESDHEPDEESEQIDLNRELSSNEPSSSSFSSSSSSTVSSTSSAKEPADVKHVQKETPLPKGQPKTTLKDYFPINKRPRQQNR